MANNNTATKISMCITVDKEVLDIFRRFCKQNGMKMSTKINNMMTDLVQNEAKWSKPAQ